MGSLAVSVTDQRGFHVVIQVEQLLRVSLPQDPGVHTFDRVGYGVVPHSHRHLDQVDRVIRIRKPVFVRMSGCEMNGFTDGVG